MTKEYFVPNCPKCSSKDVAERIYGLPDENYFNELESQGHKFIFEGCITDDLYQGFKIAEDDGLEDDDENDNRIYSCNTCSNEYTWREWRAKQHHNNSDDYHDTLIDDGIYLASTHKYISLNLLQDELGIGIERAGRMIKQLLKLGILGDYEEKTGIAKVVNAPKQSSDTPQKNLYVKVIGVLGSYKYIKTSDIQKEFSVGFGNAARVIDELADNGFIDKQSTKKGFKVL